MAAVARLATLDRGAVRAQAERFSVERMVDGYLRAYHAVAYGHRCVVTGWPDPSRGTGFG